MLSCAAVLLTTTSCGGDPAATATPSPQHSVPPGVIAPVDKARDTVDQLNQLQNRTEQLTGGSGYAP